MIRPLYLASLPLVLFSTVAIADMIYTPEGAKPLSISSNRQIYSENATGNKQRTIVDENGNLKVVERDAEPAADQMTPSNTGVAQNQTQPSEMQAGSAQQGQPPQSGAMPQQPMQPGQPMSVPQQSMQPGQSMPAPQQPMQPDQSMPMPQQPVQPQQSVQMPQQPTQTLP